MNGRPIQPIRVTEIPVMQESALTPYITKINTCLTAKPWGPTEYTRIVDLDACGNTTHERTAVIKLFENAGWRIIIKYDQRDGDYVEFQRPGAPP